MSKKINKALGTMFSGILFGSFAGLMIVVILYLFPQQTTEQKAVSENAGPKTLCELRAGT